MRRTQRTAGFVQVLALVGLSLVGGLLTVTLTQSHRTKVSLAVLERQMVADTIAATAIRRLIAAIGDPGDDLDLRVGVYGVPFRVPLAGVPVSLAIVGEAGRIDVLAADPVLLASYVEKTGLARSEQVALISSMVDARAAQDAQAAFDALYRHLIPIGRGEHVVEDFTMRSGLSGVDPLFANERVLKAVPDLTAASVAGILRERERGSVVQARSEYFSRGRALFTVVATVHWSDTERLAKRVPIEITTGGQALVLSSFH